MALTENDYFERLKEVLVSQSRPETDIELVTKAYHYAAEKHEGQFRKNQEKYIVHPVQVAEILALVPVDTPTVCAAILHDVLEDTDATPEAIKERFGPDVLFMVEGVTKLGKFQFESKMERNAENFRKMFISMAQDVRVILLKLGDRLHNMRTLEFMKPEKQVKISRETLEVFAPLANRLGMGKWRVELEDLSFKYLDPQEYDALHAQVETQKDEWEASVKEMKQILQDALNQVDVHPQIYGRVKNYLSIYRKMKGHNKQLQDVYDLGALRVIVNSEKECYEALGMVHSHFKPIPGRFKDYIAMPKSNLYQSLHTSVIGPFGRPIEVQIRTTDMHRVAEYGIAAHWKYKEKGESASASSMDEQKLSWLKQLLELKDESSDAQEFVDNVKLDLFRDEVFVFTPKGDVFDLPRESTPIDFAYRVHTQVGNSCTGAMVNGKIVTLDYQLKNGDIIEVITSKKATPKLDWIKFVRTQHARSCVRQWYKKNFKEDHIVQGRSLLEAELTKAGYEELVRNGTLETVGNQMNYVKIDDLLMAIGYGEISVHKVMGRIKKEDKRQQPAEDKKTSDISPLEVIAANPNAYRKRQKTTETKTQVEGLHGMLHHMAKCCGPLPGDAIIGVVTRSRGVMVHRDDCTNLMHVRDERKMNVGWNAQDTMSAITDQAKKTMHSIRLDVHVIDRLGIFKDVLARIADINTNVSNARVKKMMNDNTAVIEVTVDISDLDHLEQVKRVIAKLSDVISVKRAQIRPVKSSSGGD